MTLASRSWAAALFLFAFLYTLQGHTQVVGISGVLQSTSANEIDGYSATEIEDSYTASYYDVGVVGAIYQDGNRITNPISDINNPLAEVSPATQNVRFGSRYTVSSDHYLIAYTTYGNYYYNPSQYSFGDSFSPGGGIGDPTGTGYDSGGGDTYISEKDIYLGTTAFAFTPAAPQITSISPQSDVPGNTGIMQVQGQHLQDDFGVLTAAFRDNGISVTVSDASYYAATLQYTVSSVASVGGVHQLILSNTWGPSEPVTFTVASPSQSLGPPPDACAVLSGSTQSGYTSIVPTSNPGGSGSLSVSFSDPKFSSLVASVAYGPKSTPESIAASVAALVSKQFMRYGLSAKAFGRYVIYSGNTSIGTVTNLSSGPSYTTNSDAAGAANACSAATPDRYYKIEYKAYIPVDNLPGPTPCFLNLANSTGHGGLDYLGDGSAFSPTHYRVQQIVYAQTSSRSSPLQGSVIPHHGKTVNFATALFPAGNNPLPNITRAQYREADPLDTTTDPSTYTWMHACSPGLENGVGYADLSNMLNSYAHSSRPDEVKANFTGYANDPLEPSVPGSSVGAIQWDLGVDIDSSKNTVTINGSNTCYPAHQILVNDVLVYDSQPLQNKTTYLTACLTGIYERKQISSCTTSLNTATPCRPPLGN